MDPSSCLPLPLAACIFVVQIQDTLGEKEIPIFIRMVQKLEHQNWFYVHCNHKIKDSQGILKIAVNVEVVVLSLMSRKHIARAARAKPEHTSCLDQATPGCLIG
jgi:hypothetical protein